MSNIPDHSSIITLPELHSEEVQEIINRPPSWLLQWGLGFIFILLVLIFSGCWLVKYPDIVSASFTLTTTNSPKIIVARSDGKIEKLLVKDGQVVVRSQLLAFGESTADHRQILTLSDEIRTSIIAFQNDNWSNLSKWKTSEYDQLGEIQNDFQVFAQKIAELKSYLPGGFALLKRELLTKEVMDLQDMESNLKEQLELHKLDLDLSREEMKMHEKLLSEKVIAPLEFKREKAKLLNREIPMKTLLYSLIQNRSSQKAKTKEILEMDNAITEHKNGFNQALLTLRSSVESWKQRYVFTAPIAGKISFSFPWQEQQHVLFGQELLTIEPASTNFQGLIQISQANLGKIREGQNVLVKLEGYPYREFGMLEGYLSRVAATPGRDSAYWGYVTLPRQLKTRYGKNLTYKNGLRGTAEIVTADRRLAERLLSSIQNGRKIDY